MVTCKKLVVAKTMGSSRVHTINLSFPIRYKKRVLKLLNEWKKIDHHSGSKLVWNFKNVNHRKVVLRLKNPSFITSHKRAWAIKGCVPKGTNVEMVKL